MSQKKKNTQAKPSQSAPAGRGKGKSTRRNANQFQLWWVIAAVVVLALGGYWYFQRANSSSSSFPKEISVTEAFQKYESGTFLLDVRTPEEWNDYHIDNTTLIPLDELPNRLSEVPKDQEVVVVCHSGNRSGQARDILLDAGYTQVTSMAGGMIAWNNAGYALIGPGRP
ncbi:MAG: rhodanese-like domain-containing protein [Anaerolineales bacterium]|nr:rhodanese-like domain-containing protein [Anaerolineales bacterium]